TDDAIDELVEEWREDAIARGEGLPVLAIAYSEFTATDRPRIAAYFRSRLSSDFNDLEQPYVRREVTVKKGRGTFEREPAYYLNATSWRIQEPWGANPSPTHAVAPARKDTIWVDPGVEAEDARAAETWVAHYLEKERRREL